MRQMLALAILASLALVGGCTGPKAQLGYSTAEKDGRLYVFGFNSGSYQRYVQSGEIGKSKTFIGRGLEGQTVIVEDGVDASPYLAALPAPAAN